MAVAWSVNNVDGHNVTESTDLRPADKRPWTTIIRPTSPWFDLKLGELLQYRDLVYLFVRRDFVAQYKQTILGPLWYLIQPLLTTIMFTIVFGKIAKIPTDGLPQFMFFMSGTVVWSYFSKCLNKTSNTFTANASVFGKVYFPRLSVPVSILVSNLLTFCIQFLFFLSFMVYFRVRGAAIEPNLWVFLTPYLVLLMAGLGLGFGIVVSSLTTRYRDLRQLVSFGVQLLMYATPVIYPVSAIPEKYRLIILANPMTPIVESFRYAFLGAGTVRVGHLLYSTMFCVAVLFFGLILFNRVERTFMDTV